MGLGGAERVDGDQVGKWSTGRSTEWDDTAHFYGPVGQREKDLRTNDRGSAKVHQATLAQSVALSRSLDLGMLSAIGLKRLSWADV